MEKERAIRTNEEVERQATDYRNNGQVEKAVREYKELLSRFEKAGELRRAAEMQHMIGVAYKVGNHTEESLVALADALRRYKEIDSTVDVGRTLRDIGITHQYVHDYDKAKPFLEESVSVLRETGNLAELGISEVKLGSLFHECGDFKEAQEWISRGLATLEATNQWFYQATALLHAAHLNVSLQKYSAALADAERARKLFLGHNGEVSQKRRMAQLYLLESEIYSKLERQDDASEARRKADSFMEELDDASRSYLLRKI